MTCRCHSQLVGATTPRTCEPVVVASVMLVLFAVVSLMTGVAPGVPPTGYTKTWNAGPDDGAGVHA